MSIETVVVSLLIFLARLVDQSLGTMRIIYLFRGRRRLAGALGFFESATWLLAVSQVVTNVDEPIKVVAFAGGFAAGTMLGGTVEKWLALGQGVLRVVAPFESPQSAGALRSAGFAVTVINADRKSWTPPRTDSTIPRSPISRVCWAAPAG